MKAKSIVHPKIASKIAPKTPPILGVVEATDSPVARTNLLFVELKRYGELNAQGKVRMAIGFSGKKVAQPDRPLFLLLGLVLTCMRGFRYSNATAAKKDIAEFKKAIASFSARANGKKNVR